MKTTLNIGLCALGIMFLGLFLGLMTIYSQPHKAYGDSAFTSSMFNKASTTAVTTVTGDVRIFGTTTASQRAYVHICNDSANKAYLNLDNDKPVTVAAGSVTNGFPLAANSCYDINPQNLYTGAIHASSTSSSNISVSAYEL